MINAALILAPTSTETTTAIISRCALLNSEKANIKVEVVMGSKRGRIQAMHPENVHHISNGAANPVVVIPQLPGS